MKILIILKKSRGGVGFANKRLAKAFKKLGHDIKIISREEDLGKKSLINSIYGVRRYIKNIQVNFDIIYTQDWSLAFPLIFPYPIYFKKHFCCFCGNQPGIGKLFQQIIGQVFGKKLIVNGDSIKKRFPKANLIYRGIDFEEFKPLKKKRRYVGWADQCNETITENDLKKVNEKTKMSYLIAKDIPVNKMNDFYNKCKVFISLPGQGAGFNNVWAEAMAAGVPIVIGNYNGPGESFPIEKIKNRKNKINEIKEIIENPKKLDYRKWLKEKKISWENSAKKIEQVFKKFKK